MKKLLALLAILTLFTFNSCSCTDGFDPASLEECEQRIVPLGCSPFEDCETVSQEELDREREECLRNLTGELDNEILEPMPYYPRHVVQGVDSGTPDTDAGTDAGDTLDAGVDSGTPDTDAGTDAGDTLDAGPDVEPEDPCGEDRTLVCTKHDHEKCVKDKHLNKWLDRGAVVGECFPGLTPCNTDEECNDGLFCNGREFCYSGHLKSLQDKCVSSPSACSLLNSTCDEDNKLCIVTDPVPPDNEDSDSDSDSD